MYLKNPLFFLLAKWKLAVEKYDKFALVFLVTADPHLADLSLSSFHLLRIWPLCTAIPPLLRAALHQRLGKQGLVDPPTLG